MSIYGDLVTAEDVRLALSAHLELWAPAYLAEVGRQRGVTLPSFAGFTVEAGDLFPVCITACAGTDGTPERYGDGAVTATYLVGAAAVVSADTREQATAMASYYGAAIRAAVAQHPALGTISEHTLWTGESIEEVSFTTSTAIMACTERFTTIVGDVMNTYGGPLDPPIDPTIPLDAPVVTTPGVTLTRKP